MRILRAENYRRMRWKNGGGETAEIVVFPQDAGLDDFDWRVSMARVEAGGPFSLFPDVDRTLSILEGGGMLLSVEGRIPFGLTLRSDPLTFPADVATSAGLIAGPITDLNVMTRRGRCRHKVSAMEVDGSMEIPLDAAQALLFCRAGSLLVGGKAGQGRLGRFDAAMLDDGRRLRFGGGLRKGHEKARIETLSHPAIRAFIQPAFWTVFRRTAGGSAICCNATKCREKGLAQSAAVTRDSEGSTDFI